MNNAMKGVLIFAAGAGIGSLATYIFMKAKYEEIINEEMEIILDRVSNELNNTRHDPAEVEKEEVEEEVEEEEITKRTASKIVEINKYRSPSEMVEDLGIKRRREEEAKMAEFEYPREDDYHEEDEKFVSRGDPNKPYIITSDQFYNEYDHYDKLTVYFFEEDDTLVDEREEIIDDPETVIGDIPAYYFAEAEYQDADDSNIVYIRNHKLATDFEVVRREDDYQGPIWGDEKER